MDVCVHRSWEKRVDCIQTVMMSDGYIYARCVQMSSVLELPPEMPLPPDPTTPNVSKREWEQAMCMFRQDVLRIGQSGNFESGAQ